MRHKHGVSRQALAYLLALSVAAAGCASYSPYVGQGPHPQITRGHPVPPIDFIGNVFGLISKLLFLTWKIDRHSISSETERYLVAYIDSPLSEAEGSHFSLNEYAPGRAVGRLVKNRKVAWPYRLLLGLPITLVFDVLLPGRIFGGDRYNPFTDTVSIYSDLPAVALHEAGHVHDFNSRRWKGTYAALRLVPFVDLYQELQATEETFHYFIETGERQQELAAYKILYPAYGSYAGSYVFPPIGTVAGIAIGHVAGRAKAVSKGRYYEHLDAMRRQSEARDEGAIQQPQEEAR